MSEFWQNQDVLRAIALATGRAVIVTDLTGVIRYADEAAAKLVATPRSRLIGEPWSVFLPPPEGPESEAEALQTPGEHEHWVRRLDGRLQWVRSGRAQAGDAWLLTLEDAGVRVSGAAGQHMLPMNSEDPTLIFAGKRIVDLNGAALHILGAQAPEQLVGRMASELSPLHQPDGTPSAEKAVEMGRLAEQRGHHAFDWEHVRLDGKPFRVQVTLTAIRLEARPALLCVWHEAADETQRERVLRAARDSAEAAAAARAGLLAALSHEVRTPLNGVIGMLELLRETPLQPSQERYLDTALDSGITLCDLLDSMLDFARADADRITLRPESVDPRELIDDALRSLGHDAQRKGLSLVAFHGDLPSLLEVDAGRLRQVLVNLVGNAIKFTESGQVLVDARCEGGKLYIGVEDSGPGVDPEAAELLFQAFVQGDHSTTRAYGGAGLGLAICRKLTEAMGGGISYRPATGGGCRFEFNVSVRAESQPSAPLPELIGLKVRVLDEHPDRHARLEAELSGLGFRVVEEAPDLLGDLLAPEHREVRLDHLLGAREVQPDLEELHGVGRGLVQQREHLRVVDALAGREPLHVPAPIARRGAHRVRVVQQPTPHHGDGLEAAMRVLWEARHHAPVVHAPAIAQLEVGSQAPPAQGGGGPELGVALRVGVVVVHAEQEGVARGPGEAQAGGAGDHVTGLRGGAGLGLGLGLGLHLSLLRFAGARHRGGAGHGDEDVSATRIVAFFHLGFLRAGRRAGRGPGRAPSSRSWVRSARRPPLEDRAAPRR